MKNHLKAFIISIFLFSSVSQAAEKEWTFLLFLNGHNNLDSYGHMNMKQMEAVGSTSEVNLVVQWASLKNKNTKRVYVEKGSSKLLEEMAPIDMGDYKQLVEFIRWGVKNYPAKKYFISVWNHGNGWHRIDNVVQPTDISYDDLTGHKITTEELGVSMKQAAQIIGHPIDLFGTDACLMSMFEVAAEMADDVRFFAGSEEVEPAEGWPYEQFMANWVKNPNWGGAEVGTALSKEYLKAYSGGIYGTRAVTFSILDLSLIEPVYKAIGDLAKELKMLSIDQLAKVTKLATETVSFTYLDYRDLLHFTGKVAQTNVTQIPSSLFDNVKTSVQKMIVTNDVSPAYKDAQGIALWLPTEKYSWEAYKVRYNNLIFNQKTGWLNFLEVMNQNSLY